MPYLAGPLFRFTLRLSCNLMRKWQPNGIPIVPKPTPILTNRSWSWKTSRRSAHSVRKSPRTSAKSDAPGISKTRIVNKRKLDFKAFSETAKNGAKQFRKRPSGNLDVFVKNLSSKRAPKKNYLRPRQTGPNGIVFRGNLHWTLL